jgi:hypothetical protein
MMGENYLFTLNFLHNCPLPGLWIDGAANSMRWREENGISEDEICRICCHSLHRALSPVE